MKTFIPTFAVLVLLFTSPGIRAQVSLTATAGTLTGSYTTLNAAFAAIKAGTHRGAVNISITGNTVEPFEPTILWASGTGAASYTSIHISPSGGNWTIKSHWGPGGVGLPGHGIIELQGASHVTIDGDDPATPGSRNLTIQADTTSTPKVAVIRLGSMDYTGTTGASNDTIRNCIITGTKNIARPDFRSWPSSYGILLCGNDTSTSSDPPNQPLFHDNLAYGCDNDAFINNLITRCYAGMFMYGTTTLDTVKESKNLLIAGNVFGSLDSFLSNPYSIEISAIPYDTVHPLINGTIISGNDISGANSFIGIDFYGTSGEILNNNIHDLTAYRLYNRSPLTTGLDIGGYHTSNIDIHGNTVSNITGPVSSQVLGILASNTGGRIYDNNISNFIGADSSQIYGMQLTGNSETVYDNSINGLSVADYGLVYGLYNDPRLGSRIYNNRITDLSGGASCTLLGYFNAYGAPDTFYNNFIGKLYSKTSDTSGGQQTVIGAFLMNHPGSSKFFDNNTIALDTDDVAGSNPHAFSACVYDTFSQGSAFASFRNNILVNTKHSPNALGIFTSSPAAWATAESNNCYYIPNGSVAQGYTTIGAWQAATGREANSFTAGPPFVSLTDLHIDSASVAAAPFFQTGVPLAYITIDIDSQSRHAPPCIGADEFGAEPTGIDDQAAAARIYIYPNPAQNELNITAARSIKEISIIDMTGKIIYRAEAAGKQNETLDISPLADGVYIIRVATAASSMMERLAVIR